MSEKSMKTVLFLSNSVVLDDIEAELIEKCLEKQILILTYSYIEDKKADVESLRRRAGLGDEYQPEYQQIRERDSLQGLLLDLNLEQPLHVDITFAKPYHAMELAPFAYIPGNVVTALIDGEFREVGHRYLDYNSLINTKKEILKIIWDRHVAKKGEKDEDRMTVKEIAAIFSPAKDQSGPKFEHTPYRKGTIYRNLTEMVESGHLSCNKDGPEMEFYLDENQQFMYELFRRSRADSPDN